jgi:4-hydroxy-3-methylbut-2-enyl diphosphate reductase
MLASETQAIADYLRQQILTHYNVPASESASRFADTRDTLCYATNDNQGAMQGMLAHDVDLAIVIGGYNSSNTSHLAELCAQKLPTYYINNEDCLVSATEIRHFDEHTHTELTTAGYLPATHPLRVMITSGASCPDALVERVIHRLAAITGNDHALPSVLEQWQ